MKAPFKYKFYIFTPNNCRVETRSSPDPKEFEGLPYLINPDVSHLPGVKLQYYKKVGEAIVEMTHKEKLERDKLHKQAPALAIPERVITREIKVEVIKEIDRPIEKIIEKLVYVDKPYPVEVQVEIIKEVVKEIIKEVEKPIERIVEKEKIITQDKIIFKTPLWCYATHAVLSVILIYFIFWRH